MTRLSTRQQTLVRLSDQPNLNVQEDGSNLLVRRGVHGVAWCIEFDEAGRVLGGYRTDLAATVTGTYVRSLSAILASLGVKAGA